KHHITVENKLHRRLRLAALGRGGAWKEFDPYSSTTLQRNAVAILRQLCARRGQRDDHRLRQRVDGNDIQRSLGPSVDTYHERGRKHGFLLRGSKSERVRPLGRDYDWQPDLWHLCGRKSGFA